MRINRPFFYDTAKSPEIGLFTYFGKKQTEGIEALFAEWEKRNLADMRWLAYILATVYHETGRTMQPIEEFGKGKKQKYGKPDPVTGMVYFGRGHTQNTWAENYKKLTIAAEGEGHTWDFYKNPSLLLQMAPSVWATYHGMLNGLYTGKKLSDYFNGDTYDWLNARRIINGIDRAEDIARYAKNFLKCLSSI